jgi:hypothetical protein
MTAEVGSNKGNIERQLKFLRSLLSVMEKDEREARTAVIEKGGFGE